MNTAVAKGSLGLYRFRCLLICLANALMAAGIGLMASRIGFVILLMGMTLFVIRLLLREEAELSRAQGELYRRYCSVVPRLVPSLMPRVPPAGNTPNWTEGFRAELMYWLLTLAMGAFAITLNIKIFWGIFIPAMASSWLLKRSQPKHASPTLLKR